MAPRGFRQASRGKRQIKGSIGGGGGKGNLKRKAPGAGTTTPTTTTTTTPPDGTNTPPPYVKDPTDPTLFRSASGAFTTEGWVNVPGGRVYVLPGDTMSEAINQGRFGLIPMAKTERSRSAGGAYTQGGYVRTGESGSLSVAKVRAGDTRSEVIGAARAAASGARSRAAAQSSSVNKFRALERTGVGVATTSARATSATRGGASTPAGRTPAKASPKAAPKAAPKSASSKKPTVVPKGKSTAMRAK
jgi:hypothetical protein